MDAIKLYYYNIRGLKTQSFLFQIRLNFRTFQPFAGFCPRFFLFQHFIQKLPFFLGEAPVFQQIRTHPQRQPQRLLQPELPDVLMVAGSRTSGTVCPS